MKKSLRLLLLFLLPIFHQCSNDNWQKIEIENLSDIKNANESYVEKYKLQKIQNVTGRYKFLTREKVSSFGYVFEINIDSLDKSEFDKTSFNKTDTVEIGNKKQILGQTIGLDYQFEIEFQFYDKDNFIIYTVKDSCDAETGKKNIIQKELKSITPQALKDTKKVKAKLYLRDYIEMVS
ncbi:MAG: hypothetical protein HY840_04020 [Bacteroidetes bacterium]|nr:hypothetical protein [Bacteroidota bacterium]